MITEYIKKTTKKVNKKTKEVLVKKTTLCGCLTAFKNDAEEVVFGYSKYAKTLEDQPFSKVEALKRAQGRANAGRTYHLSELPHSIRKSVMKFSDRCQRYFKKNISNLVLD